VGEQPAGVATLSGGAESQKRFDKAVAELWGSKDEKPGVFSKMLSGRKPEAAGVRKVGRGRVIPGMPLEEALRQQRIEPDLTGEGVVWSHRQVEGADWYFVAAPLKQGFNGTLRFRSTGKVELWNPQTGEVSPAGIVRYDGNGTLVALNIPPSAAVFVLFNGDQNPQSAVVRVEHNGECIADAGAPHAADFVVREEVLSASYGDPKNNERRIDVAEKIRSALARGETEVRPGNGWAGGDPALGTPKRLFVSLRLPDGSEKKLEARENQALELTESRIEPLPVCEIMDGGKRLLAWEPGRYSIRRADDKPVGFESRLARRISLSGPWKLSFPPGWGAPESVEIPQLLSWTGLEMPPEAKAFSGTALYSTEFTLDKLPDNGGVMIDLGDVAVIARVRVNGKPVGTVWSVPYRLDISTAAKAGINRLEVEVTSTWFNRLAYDAGLPEAERKTWTIKGPGKGSALKPAGLIGPVTICVGESFPFR